MAANPTEVANQAYITYVSEKGFPPKNATQLINFSKLHHPPFVGIKYIIARNVVANPPEIPQVSSASAVTNPYLDESITKNFISPNNDKNPNTEVQMPTKSKIANAYDSYVSQLNKHPNNAMEFLGFCETNSLKFTYAECNDYLQHTQQKEKSVNQSRVHALSKALLNQNVNVNPLNISSKGLIQLSFKSGDYNAKKFKTVFKELSELANINTDEKYELNTNINELTTATVVPIIDNQQINNELSEYLDTMTITNMINVTTPEEIISKHSYHDERYNIRITPITPDPVLSVHLDISYNIWDINMQNEFVKDLACELNVNASQLIPICVSSGSVKFIVQICNVIKEKFPLIEKKCVTLKKNANKICEKWKLNASKLQNWAAQKLGFTAVITQPKMKQVAGNNDNILNTAEKWLLNQAESLRAQIMKSLQDCPNEYEISAICALDNDECLAEFIKIDGWKNSKLLFHGTKLAHLSSIYEKGFNDKFIGTSTDAGWYGKGHYFTSYPQYSMPYCEANQFGQYTLIVSYVNVGNTFQIYDNITYYGKTLKTGYSSHYVQVTGNGQAVPKNEINGYLGDMYDEYIVNTGKRVLPRFCVTFTKKENVIIWRDAKLSNDENSNIMDKLRKSNVIYGALTTKDALKVIQKKKKSCSVYIITNGADNSDGFINSIRNKMKIENPILVFTSLESEHKYLSEKFSNVTVTTSTSEVYNFVKKYIANTNEIAGQIMFNDTTKNSNPNPTLNTDNDNKINDVYDDTDDEYDDVAVVLDNGSHTIKAGFAGDVAPKVIINSVVGRPKNVFSNPMKVNEISNIYVGDKALAKSKMLSLKYPIERGNIRGFCYGDSGDNRDIESLWHHTFYNELRICPEEHAMLFIEPVLNTRMQRENTTQMIFEKFSVPAFYMGNVATLTLLACSCHKQTGIVCDIGHGLTQIVPFWEGYPLPHAIQKVNLSGKDLTECMMELLKEKGHSFTKTEDLKSIERMKEQYCYVANDYYEELEQSDEKRNWKLPDGKVITIGVEQFKCTEILFEPRDILHYSDLYNDEDVMYNKDRDGIHNLIYNCAFKCDQDIRKDLFSNIILAGGSTLLTGFEHRLSKELKCLVGDTFNTKVIATPERKHWSWIGGSAMALIKSYDEDTFIQKDEYDESGPSIVHRKCNDSVSIDI